MNSLDQLRELIESGTRQLAFMEHDRPGGAPFVTAKRAATSASFSLRELQAAAGESIGTIHPLLEPKQRPAGEMLPVSANIMKRSRVAQAGATILVVEESAKAIPVGRTGDLAYVDTTRRFVTVEAAPFALVPEPAAPALPDVPESAPPVSRVTVAFDGPSYGVRFKLTRRHTTDFGLDQVLQELMQSIGFGLARAADHALLSAIVAAVPAPFTLGAAAASGVEFQELRALVGTNAAGAAVGQDGQLRAAGIVAELTPTIAPTIVGSFSRSGVAVDDSLRILVERRNAANDLVVTCWSDLQALLPDGSFFWTAA